MEYDVTANTGNNEWDDDLYEVKRVDLGFGAVNIELD